MDLKQYIPQVIAMLAVLAGGGTLGTIQYNASGQADDTRYATVHTATITADLVIELYKLKERVKELEDGLDK